MIYIGNIYAGLGTGGGTPGMQNTANGISGDGSVATPIILGGNPLIKNTSIPLNGFDFGLSDGNIFFLLTHGTNQILAAVSDGLGTDASITVLPGEVLMEGSLSGGGTCDLNVKDTGISLAANFAGTQSISITPFGVPITLADSNNSKWAVYAGDYHVNSIANPRSIPDLGYIETLIAGTGPVATNKVAGTTGGNLIVYPLTQSTPTLFRVGCNGNSRSGVGSLTVIIQWTDTSGAVNTTSLLGPITTAPDNTPGFAQDFYVLNGTTITINASVSPGSTFDIATIIQQLI